MSAGVHVVIEAIFDSGPRTEFNTRVECLERFCHEVGGGVPEGGFAIVVVPGEELNGCIGGDRASAVPDFTVYAGSEDFLCQAFADGAGDFYGGNALRVLGHTAIGEGNMNHIR